MIGVQAKPDAKEDIDLREQETRLVRECIRMAVGAA
jgi:hypothetical protein